MRPVETAGGTAGRLPDERRHLLLASAGLLFLLVAMAPALGISPRLAESGRLGQGVMGLLLAGFAYLGAVRLFQWIPRQRRPLWLWTGAIGLRLVALALPPDEEVWRYVWDGQIQRHAVNPYTIAPDAARLAPYRNAAWERVSRKEHPASHPPGAEAFFAGITRFSSDPRMFKILAAVADLMIVALLLRMITGPGRYRATSWYAWNPLVIWAFAGGGRCDAVMLLALTLAAWALHKGNPLGVKIPSWKGCLVSCLFLGVAISFNLVALILLPAFAIGFGRRSVLLPGSLAIPFLWAQAYGGWDVVYPAVAGLATGSHVKGLGWWVVDPLLALSGYRNAPHCLLALIAAGFAMVVCRRNWRDAVLAGMGVFLIFSPSFDPWHLAWILPFAAWRWRREWFLFAASCPAVLLIRVDGPYWQKGMPSAFVWSLVVVPLIIGMLARKIQYRTVIQ